MVTPGRKFEQANSAYRYGFNGKEKDKDISEGGQDYGLRIYDSRIGKFLSVDPLSKEYPWNSTYAFAENDVIRNVDLDGGERKLATMSQYEYNGSWGWFDFLKCVPNAAGKVYNSTIAGTYNSGVDFYNSCRRGTVVSDTKEGFKQFGNDIKQSAITTWDYTIHTPIQQQFVDAGKMVINPRTWEDGLALYFGAKMFPVGGGKGNLLKLETETAATVKGTVQNTPSKIGATGAVGERYLKTLGGVSQKYFATEIGVGGRFVDQFVNGVANESKVGYTTLTSDVKMQIAKDVELLKNSAETGVKKVVWNFFESPITGKAGASKSLQEALKKAGIETTVIRNP